MAKLRRSPRKARKWKAIRGLENAAAMVASGIQNEHIWNPAGSQRANLLVKIGKKIKRGVRRGYANLDR